MNDDIGAMLKGPEEIRCAKCIIYYDRKSCCMCKFCNGVNIRNICIRIS